MHCLILLLQRQQQPSLAVSQAPCTTDGAETRDHVAAAWGLWWVHDCDSVSVIDY